MPVRSSSSRVLRWPDENEVRLAAARFAERESARPELIRLGYFGSYANGTWGVGSDLDLVAVVSDSEEPFERRALSWDLALLPVPADEVDRLVGEEQHHGATARHDAERLVARVEHERVPWVVGHARLLRASCLTHGRFATQMPMRNKDLIYVANSRAVEKTKFMDYIRTIDSTIQDPINTGIAAYTLKGLIQGGTSGAAVIVGGTATVP